MDITEKQFDVEQWRPVVGYEGFYEVSNLGRVRRVGRATGARLLRVLKMHPLIHGYLGCHLSKANRTKTAKLHQLVAMAFLGECPRGCEVNHKDGDKTNCCHNNLEYVSHQYNQAHAVKLGLYRHGEQLPQAKLAEQDVREIRRLRGVESQRHLAGRFGVSQHLIKEIQLRRVWKHIR